MTALAQKIDFPAVNAAALAQCPDLLCRLLPGGKARGREYVCSDLRGGNGDSLSVNLDTGAWADFAGDARGGDFVSLLAAVRGISQGQAAREIPELLGTPLENSPNRTPQNAKPTKGNGVVMPVPSGAPDPSEFKHYHLGRPDELYQYRDANGKLLFCSARFYERREGKIVYDSVKGSPEKTIRPLTYSYEGWVCASPPNPCQMYRLDKLAGAPRDAEVLIFEGERKADDVASVLGTDKPTLSIFGGSGRVGKNDLSPLKGRNVVIWPDFDAAGKKAALILAEALLKARAASVEILDIADAPFEGWDAGNAVADGWDSARLTAYIEQRRVEYSPQAVGGGSPALKVSAADPRMSRAAPLAANGNAFDDPGYEQMPADAYEAEPEAQGKKAVKGKGRAGNDKPAKAVKAPDPTEDDLALDFVTNFGRRFRYCHTDECWYLWDEKRWTRDKKKSAAALMREICRRANTAGKASVARYLTTRGALSFASIDPRMSVISEMFDVDPWMLGSPGGVVDLRTGRVEKADPMKHMITKLAGVGPADEEDCPRWFQFLDESTKGDKETQAFLKRGVGYCLTGSIREHALFFVFGKGGNGKGVFLNIVNAVLGDYATTAAMTTFTERKHEGHPEDLAMLAGARLVSSSETEEGRAWAESRVKQMTGGDAITAAYKYGHNFTFYPQFKLFIIGNHQPVLRNVGEAMKRRINMVPFLNEPLEKDLDLEEKLRAELPGIMRWAISGCLEWQKFGLNRPQAVEEATAEYFETQDLIGQWLDECCDDLRKKPGGAEIFTLTKDLFASWRAFSEERRQNPGTDVRFTMKLKDAGFESARTKTGRGIRALQIKATEPRHDGRMAAAGEPPDGRFPDDDPGYERDAPWFVQ